MPISTTSRRRLAALAAACLLSVAMPMSAALAQKSKTKGEPAAQTTSVASSSQFSVDIPTIDAVDSNVDDAALRDILSGNIVGNAEALAGLSATSITIPEIILDAITTLDGETNEATFTLTDLVLADVVDGVAATVTLASMSLETNADGGGEFGALSASNLDIGGILGIYGLVDGSGQTELKTIYSDFSFEGGTVSAPEVECTIGSMTAAEFKARPLQYSFTEIMALSEAIDDQDDMPAPETMGAMLRMYADVLTAFESSPVEFGGFDCTGVDDEDRPVMIAVAGMTMGGMSPGIYPSIAIEGVEIEVENDGAISIGNATFKAMDLAGPIAAIQAAPAALDEAWFIANARALIPAFEGFSFDDISVDVPDPDIDGARIIASISAFDLTLGSYLNGIPTDVFTNASNIVVELPETSDDPQLQQLLDMGVTSIDAGFTIDAAWNEIDNTIAINEVSFTGADLATVVLAGTIANATEALFAVDENEALAAAMAVAVAGLKLDVTDQGLADIILARVAADQGANAETLRPVYAGLAEGTIIGMLVGVAEAQKVGAAVSAFVSGKAKQLTIELTAKEAPGINLVDFIAAESDPSQLISKVNIDATSK